MGLSSTVHREVTDPHVGRGAAVFREEGDDPGIPRAPERTDDSDEPEDDPAPADPLAFRSMLGEFRELLGARRYWLTTTPDQRAAAKRALHLAYLRTGTGAQDHTYLMAALDEHDRREALAARAPWARAQ